MKVVTAAQMAAIEQASERAGVSTDTLMENAGLSVARAAREELGGAAGARVVVLVGPGNNGADGLVAARHLRRWGADVVCCLLGRPHPNPLPEGEGALSSDPKLDLALRYDVEIVAGPGGETLERLIGRSHLVIDAVLGTGRSRPLAGPVGDAMLLLRRTRESRNPPFLIALDLPTGLNADTGEADPACPLFDVTLALGYPKVGLLTFPGAERVGRLRVLDIGVPPGLPEEQSVEVEMLTPEWTASRLPPRPLNSHKGTYGHALVVAGSRQYVGAAWLASQASVRTGAGLTTLASSLGVYPIAAAKGAEVIHLPLPEDVDGRIYASASEVIGKSDRRFTAALVGCGMGWSEGTTEFLRKLLPVAALRQAQGERGASAQGERGVAAQGDGGAPVQGARGVTRQGERSVVVQRERGAAPAGIPVLVDADGLNNLSGIEGWHKLVDSPLVLTPHPGEMSTLTGVPVGHIQADRLDVAREWAEKWGATVVLKGAHTVIASPGHPVRIAPFANPGLATGGTGDVLSGVIVSLLAQGLAPADAAAVGVYLHAAAGESVTRRIGQAGLAASDLLEELPQAIASLRHATLD